MISIIIKIVCLDLFERTCTKDLCGFYKLLTCILSGLATFLYHLFILVVLFAFRCFYVSLQVNHMQAVVSGMIGLLHEIYISVYSLI